MILLKQSETLSKFLSQKRREGKAIGFVPTMGALHQGHLTLLKAARDKNLFTVVSIFVNPTQFNDPADFKKYPVTIDRDVELLLEEHADLLFLPTQQEIYPASVERQKHYALGRLETVLEGEFRPGHFQGVCQVMDRLLRIVSPCELFMGRKDYQQCMVIETLIEQTGIAAHLHIVDTVRENDGLAMSSRNLRLNEGERKTAPTIYQALRLIKDNIKAGDQHALLQKAKRLLSDSGFRIDYLELADARTLEPVTTWDGERKIVSLVAAFLNEVRLIDNFAL